MQITQFDKLKTRLRIFSILGRLVSLKQAVQIAVNPIDAVRDIEFTYMLKFLERNHVKPTSILDVSSPYILAYLFSREASVLKTDINAAEQKSIREQKNLSFRLEDATQLSMPDETFDLVYAISVIEHIYEKYVAALREMIRVTKPGGLIYVTFPVASLHREEWLEQDVYSHQHRDGERVFFQYRFDEADVAGLLAAVDGVDVVSRDVYWEKSAGAYDRLMARLSLPMRFKPMAFIRNGIWNALASMYFLNGVPAGFEQQGNVFGNASIFLRKRLRDGR